MLSSCWQGFCLHWHASLEQSGMGRVNRNRSETRLPKKWLQKNFLCGAFAALSYLFVHFIRK
ncbi:unnamed protein product [Meloidogyne enterolobii]|uniref:Uncharacterized protein n=1 Tax=Meloidogyne enterolobii TaxID=390850 RepID=A0ACB0YS57_MELEN